MSNLKFKVIKAESGGDFEERVNLFLKTIDVRQIIKIDHQYDNGTCYRGFVYYLEKDDFTAINRDIKIDTILFKKNN